MASLLHGMEWCPQDPPGACPALSVHPGSLAFGAWGWSDGDGASGAQGLRGLGLGRGTGPPGLEEGGGASGARRWRDRDAVSGVWGCAEDWVLPGLGLERGDGAFAAWRSMERRRQGLRGLGNPWRERDGASAAWGWREGDGASLDGQGNGASWAWR